eukprot:SAG11_NODE_16326_length_550_cov_2.028825_1_plen_159_part_10
MIETPRLTITHVHLATPAPRPRGGSSLHRHSRLNCGTYVNVLAKRYLAWISSPPEICFTVVQTSGSMGQFHWSPQYGSKQQQPSQTAPRPHPSVGIEQPSYLEFHKDHQKFFFEKIPHSSFSISACSMLNTKRLEHIRPTKCGRNQRKSQKYFLKRKLS